MTTAAEKTASKSAAAGEKKAKKPKKVVEAVGVTAAQHVSKLMSKSHKPNRAIRAAFEAMWTVDGRPGVWTYDSGCSRTAEPKKDRVKIEIRPGAFAMLKQDAGVAEVLEKLNKKS